MTEYHAALRVSRGTSGHECEELIEFLNRYASDGWRLRQIIQQAPGHQLIIFEREHAR